MLTPYLSDAKSLFQLLIKILRENSELNRSTNAQVTFDKHDRLRKPHCLSF
jgi:hypothetical protein